MALGKSLFPEGDDKDCCVALLVLSGKTDCGATERAPSTDSNGAAAPDVEAGRDESGLAFCSGSSAKGCCGAGSRMSVELSALLGA